MKGIVLLSGGIDSPVAAKLMSNRGVEIIAVHFDNQQYTDEAAREKIILLCKKSGIKKIYIIKHGANQKEFMEKCNRRYQCLFCKRMMLRISEKIAQKERADFLITGENLGQVASQTLDNMKITDSAVKIKILRPLLCFDKNEIINIAKKIGTYEISITKSVGCLAVPDNPITKGKFEIMKKEEKKINIDVLVENSIKTAKLIEI